MNDAEQFLVDLEDLFDQFRTSGLDGRARLLVEFEVLGAHIRTLTGNAQVLRDWQEFVGHCVGMTKSTDASREAFAHGRLLILRLHFTYRSHLPSAQDDDPLLRLGGGTMLGNYGEPWAVF